VARWVQSGTFWQVDAFVPEQSHGTYPNHGDVLQLAVFGPFRNDAFVRLVNVPLLALAGLASYALARELRASAAAAALAAALLLAIPVVLLPGVDQAQTDALLVAAYPAGLLFLLRHWRTGAGSDLVLAGLALGLAVGTKWYGVPAVFLTMVVWLTASVAARRRLSRVFPQALALAALVVLAGGFWLARNWVETGNPLFPAKVELLGVTVFDAPPDRVREEAGFAIADYAGEPAVVADYVLPGLFRGLGTPAIALLAGLAVALATVRRWRPAERRALVAGALLAAALALAYAVTPYSALGPEDRPLFVSANARYAVPALIVCAALAARGLTALPWTARVVAAALGFVAVTGGIVRSLTVADPGRREAVAVALLLAAGAIAVAGARAWRAGRRVPARAAAVGGGIAAVVLAAAGWGVAERYNDDRYAAADPALAWIESHAPAGVRVGLAGDWSADGISPVWPMFGSRARNRVEYVGPYRRELLGRYEDRDAFLTAVRRGGYDLVLVGRFQAPKSGSNAERWAGEGGLRPVAASERFMLFAVPGGRAG
jgi:4-amino-4-deoxy-L-arabinose transferase-like glycosyltransferase